MECVKKSKEDFIQDYCNRSPNYCNRRESLNSTPDTNRDKWAFIAEQQDELVDGKLLRGTWLGVKDG